ncbi:hypothetical protein Tco_0228432 [Tanacetum coccineum]
MLIFSKTLEFLWAEAIATAYFTQNRSLIHTRSLCYQINDRDDLRKMKPNANIVPSKEDLDNLFGPLYEEYYETSTPKVSDDSAENTLDSKDTPSLSSIVVEEDEAPQILTSSEEPIANESTTSVSNENDNETIQKDVLAFDGNDFYDPLYSLMLEEADLSLTF